MSLEYQKQDAIGLLSGKKWGYFSSVEFMFSRRAMPL